MVPCYNVATQIDRMLETIPGYVDHIICIDDKSTDDTLTKLKSRAEADRRIVLCIHEQNQGVGGAISTGYAWARDHNIEVAVVMAGDGQMDPKDLPYLIKPVATGDTDYAKGNRFYHPEVLNKMPKIRLMGNIVLSFLTKLASGYWHIADSQCGYTAVSLRVLKAADLGTIYKRYGMPNDFLVTLNILEFSVLDVPVNPIYGIGEKSGICIPKVIFTISRLLTGLFYKRLIIKYLYQSFHPLILLYFFGLPALLIGVGSGLTLVLGDIFLEANPPHYGRMMLFTLLIITGYFSIVMAMFMDMEHNRPLYRRGHVDIDEDPAS